MCGISALSLRKPDPGVGALALAMVRQQQHRGPDCQTSWMSTQHTYALGHARLSIVDLSSAGNQPLTNETGTIQVVCNGELYNYRKLRSWLQGKGHTFRSHSDTEVLVHLYEQLGTNLFDRLHGMYAFVLYDAEKDLLLCGRDRLGKKPLVYAETEAGVAIASEIPPLHRFPGVDLSVDPMAVGLYVLRNVRHIPDPWTFYKGIRRLEPGHAMVVRAGRIERRWSYWHPQFSTHRSSAEEVLEVFDRAVAMRGVADVEVGALLSGGVDSTAIVQAMKAQSGEQVRTYALGKDANDPELLRARIAAKRLDTIHREFYFDPTRQHVQLEHLWKLYGEPIMLLPLAFAYELFQHARDDGLRVVMTGHGADEIFYGYTGNNRMTVFSLLASRVPALLHSPLALLAEKDLPKLVREGLLVASHNPGMRKAALYLAEARKLWPTLFADPSSLLRTAEQVIPQWLQLFFGSGAPKEYIDEANFLGLMHENAHSVTIAGDLPAMAASVEVRCPFLDQELVSLALSVPFWQKVPDPLHSERNKWILKQALRGRVPEDVLFAQKFGFGYHLQESDVLRGPWKQSLDECFSSGEDLGGMLNRKALLQLKSTFDQGQPGVVSLVAKVYAMLQFRNMFRTVTTKDMTSIDAV